MSTVTSQRSVGDSMATTGLATAGVSLGGSVLLRKALFNNPIATRPGNLALTVLAVGAAGTAIDYTNRNGDRNSMLQSAGLGVAITASGGLLAAGLSKPLAIEEMKPGLHSALRQKFPGGHMPRVTGGSVAAMIGTGALMGAVVHAFTND